MCARSPALLAALVVSGLTVTVCDLSAQSLGTFRWQLQPYCNVLTLNVTQTGGNFTVDGTDDLCGTTPSPAAAVGLAFPKPDGTIGLGISLVLAPSGVPVHISASISTATVSGPWQDSSGNTGNFVFNPAIAPGSPRPFPKPAFASGLSVVNARITEVGAPTAATDAANKAYVDTAATTAPREGWIAVYSNATINARSANLAGATVQRIAGYPTGVYCFSLPAGTGLQDKGAVATVQQLGGGGGIAGIAVVSALYNTVCSQAGFPFSVHTYNAAGTLQDLPFTVLIPR